MVPESSIKAVLERLAELDAQNVVGTLANVSEIFGGDSATQMMSAKKEIGRAHV